MCHACGINHFEEDDIDYDDEELMAILGIDGLNNSSPPNNKQTNHQNILPIFVAVNEQDNQVKGVTL